MNTYNRITALEAYTNRVYRIIVLIIPVFCLCASATINFLHHAGWYPDISQSALILFTAADFVFLMIGIFFIKTGFDEEGVVKKTKLVQAKYTMALIVILQWNGISYIWPFRDFWGYALLFTIVEAFFFDVKLVGFTTAGITVSMVISWIVNGDRLLPPQDQYFMANMTFRIVGLVLMLGSVILITYFGGKFLVEELEKHVNYDTLTHLLNRRSMDRYFEQAYRKAQKGGKPLSFLLMDIDDFKKVNDTYGHDCGDEILKYAASTVSTAINRTDTAFRWGGEEFLVLLDGDGTAARSVAERIRKLIMADSVIYRGEVKVPITVTIGISSYSPGKTIQQMMDEADKNLYYGKTHGKNQTVVQVSEITKDTQTSVLNSSGTGA